MIVDLLMFAGSGILQIISLILSGLSFVIPDQIETALGTAFGYIWYFDGILPVSSLLQVLSALVSFMVAWYTYKILMWLLKVIPTGGGGGTHKDDK